jgi:hypothetical protein
VTAPQGAGRRARSKLETCTLSPLKTSKLPDFFRREKVVIDRRYNSPLITDHCLLFFFCMDKMPTWRSFWVRAI